MPASTILTTTLIAADNAGSSGNAVVTAPIDWQVHRFFTSWSSGTPTVLLEGSHDGTSWFTAATITVTGDMTELAGGWRHLRTSFTGATATTITSVVEQIRSNGNGSIL